MPRLRFPGFEGAWEERLFSSLYRYVCEKNDGTFREDAIISVANMYFKADVKIVGDDYLLTYNVLRVGDIAFEGHRSKEFAYGRFVENTIGDGIISHVFVVFRPILPSHNIVYWQYAINNERTMRGVLARCTKAATMMMSIVPSDFLSQKILVPSNNEQAKIGSLLLLVDARIAAQRKLVELLKKHKRGVIEEIFGQDNTDWNRCRLGDIATINPSTGTLPSEFYYIDLESVSDGVWGRRTLVRREDAPSRAQRNVALEDILFQTVRPYQQNNYFVGCELDKPVVASTGYAQIRTREEPLFVYWMLHSPSFLREVILRCTGSGYPAVNAADLAEIVVAVPNRADQRRYATLITQIAKRCNAEEAILSLLESSKRGLLQKLFV